MRGERYRQWIALLGCGYTISILASAVLLIGLHGIAGTEVGQLGVAVLAPAGVAFQGILPMFAGTSPGNAEVPAIRVVLAVVIALTLTTTTVGLLLAKGVGLVSFVELTGAVTVTNGLFLAGFTSIVRSAFGGNP